MIRIVLCWFGWHKEHYAFQFVEPSADTPPDVVATWQYVSYCPICKNNFNATIIVHDREVESCSD